MFLFYCFFCFTLFCFNLKKAFLLFWDCTNLVWFLLLSFTIKGKLLFWLLICCEFLFWDHANLLWLLFCWKMLFLHFGTVQTLGLYFIFLCYYILFLILLWPLTSCICSCTCTLSFKPAAISLIMSSSHSAFTISDLHFFCPIEGFLSRLCNCTQDILLCTMTCSCMLGMQSPNSRRASVGVKGDRVAHGNAFCVP